MAAGGTYGGQPATDKSHLFWLLILRRAFVVSKASSFVVSNIGHASCLQKAAAHNTKVTIMKTRFLLICVLTAYFSSCGTSTQKGATQTPVPPAPARCPDGTLAPCIEKTEVEKTVDKLPAVVIPPVTVATDVGATNSANSVGGTNYPPYNGNQNNYPPYNGNQNNYPPYNGDPNYYPPYNGDQNNYPPYNGDPNYYPPSGGGSMGQPCYAGPSGPPCNQGPLPPPNPLAGSWACTAVDRGFEEHGGGHTGFGRTQAEGVDNAMHICLISHGECSVLGCEPIY
jgi:hypothetical protein